MANFLGGSAYAMAQQISEGFVLVTERTLQRLVLSELDQLGFELERLLRDLRGEQPPLDDIPALRLRNRRIQRLTSTRLMIQSYRLRRRA